MSTNIRNRTSRRDFCAGGTAALVVAAVFAWLDKPPTPGLLLLMAAGWLANGIARAWIARRRIVRIDIPGGGHIDIAGRSHAAAQELADQVTARIRDDR